MDSGAIRCVVYMTSCTMTQELMSSVIVKDQRHRLWYIIILENHHLPTVYTVVMPHILWTSIYQYLVKATVTMVTYDAKWGSIAQYYSLLHNT